ncbi:IclR family transcriptional regulator [Allorhizobium sp. BGMRC 0089]|uniref:IclR family transcriptional regulator n=1 Tax=Allorhizobium sonneratiae TaxID=2934936 RepID=UPI002033AE2B|nr:IclR family transcriptional regulator [Allorhizobium sonneratiae]MCM2293906.1 IclR family transcriptional regulator [Allorhizobium sonneratiae]
MTTETAKPAAKDNPKNSVQSVVKAFSVMRSFTPEHFELSISDVAKRTGLDRGTAYRLLHTLQEEGYVAAVPRTRRFRLTLKCLELGYTTLTHFSLRELSRPLLSGLLDDVADAASLGMIDGPDVVYMERIQGDMGGRQLERRVGVRVRIYAAALGQAILAYEPQEVQRRVLEMSPRIKLSESTITDLDALLDRLAIVRQRGWAFSDGENAYGLRTVAAPVFDARGNAIAAISATVTAERWQNRDQFIEKAVPRVLAVTQELSEAIRISGGAINIGRNL